MDLQWSNQKSFQKAVIENHVNGRVLPMTHFVNGEMFFENMPANQRNDVTIIHNNCIVGKARKTIRFQQFNLWSRYVQKG